MSPVLLTNDDLRKLQKDTFGYFLHETNEANGLVPDNTRKESPCTITAVGLALSAYTVGVEQGLITRSKAIQRVLTALRFFWNSPQGDEPDATGYKGFYYHFLDMESGRRQGRCELSTIDTTYLLAGVLAVGAYFDHDTGEEAEIRQLADSIYRRVDWIWALNGGLTVSHGGSPEKGFIPYRWEGYNEATILYILGLGSPTYPLPEESYKAWMSTYQWREIYGYEFLYGSSLFMHQLSHVWIDFRGIQDAFMREKNSDYFENSRRATYVQQAYAKDNPRGFKGYHENCWGITASDGPGNMTRQVNGVERQFYGYAARGVPDDLDDGTIAPWAATASLPFAPEIVLPTLACFNDDYPQITSKYGFKCSFNPTFPADDGSQQGWMSQGYYGLDQGPIVVMIENYLTGFFWQLMKRCPYLVTGLRRAGFTGGWLSNLHD